MTRRDFGKGIAAILAAGVAPSVLAGGLRRGLAGRLAAMSGGSAYIGSPVLWLDGIENTRNGHVNSSMAWQDISGHLNDYVVTPTEASGSLSSLTFDNNALVLPSSNFAYVAQSENRFHKDVLSYEAFIDIPSFKCAVFFFYSSSTFSTDNGCRWLAFNDGSTISTSNKCAFSFNGTTGVHHIYAEFKQVPAEANGFCTKLIFDGQNLTAKTYSGNWFTKRCTIGYNNTGWSYHGKIHRIMAHNRALSEAEVANNYAVDRARFGIA